MLRIAIPLEPHPAESRVAATPDSIKSLSTLGAAIQVQRGAGTRAGIPDAEYERAGAVLTTSSEDTVANAGLVLTVRGPDLETLKHIPTGATLVGMLDPYDAHDRLKAYAAAGITAFSMELLPRITRAQVMDVLSSQANLAGYRAVIDAAAHFSKLMPMMMTAAGTIPAAKVFVMGAGVAGLQAIATARRLGAIVTATDVRPAAKEQVESLGAKFIAVEDDEFRNAETAGGYAKPMSDDYQAKQAELVASHIAKQDMVITTALIPGRKAPVLVTTSMVESMRSGSVIVDLAVERGGNVELAKLGEVVVHDGVTIVGYENMPGRVAASASALYAKNLTAFVTPLIDTETSTLAIPWDDELIQATCLTRDGAIVHPKFTSAAEPQPSGQEVTT